MLHKLQTVTYSRKRSASIFSPAQTLTLTLILTLLKAGGAGIECSLKTKQVLVPVMVGAAPVQTLSLSSVLSSSRS